MRDSSQLGLFEVLDDISGAIDYDDPTHIQQIAEYATQHLLTQFEYVSSALNLAMLSISLRVSPDCGLGSYSNYRIYIKRFLADVAQLKDKNESLYNR